MSKICYNCFRELQETDVECPHCHYNVESDRARYPLALPAGHVLCNMYVLGRVLGQGGYGITYLAWDKVLGIRVAVKEYFPEIGATRDAVTCQVTASSVQKTADFNSGKESFLKEARVLAAFTENPNIVHIYGCFEENGTAYFAMEYIEGISLQQYIRLQGGKIAWNDAYAKLMPIIVALEDVHKQEIIHRDISPDNIFITSDGNVKLLDFGAARLQSLNGSHSLDVILKHGYAPFEQYKRKGKQGPFSDIYALCACFYASITGELPPDATDRVEQDTLKSFQSFGLDIPAAVEMAIFKGMAVVSDKRYQTMGELRVALETALQVAPVPIPMPVPTPIPVVYPNQSVTPNNVVYPNQSVNSNNVVYPNQSVNPNNVVYPNQSVNPNNVVYPNPSVTPNNVVYPNPSVTPNNVVYPNPSVTPNNVVPLSPNSEVASTLVVTSPTSDNSKKDESATDGEQKRKAFPKKYMIGIAAACAVLLFLVFWFAHPHQYSAWVVKKEATCSDTGLQERKCFCGKKDEEEIPMLEHKIVRDDAVEATCASTGLTEGSHCSVCGITLEKQEIVSTLSYHTMGILSAVEPTCTEVGYTEGKGCTVCGYTEIPREEIPPTGHKEKKIAAVEPTCSEEGQTEGAVCAVCDAILEEPTKIAKTEHTPEKSEDVPATCTTEGKTGGTSCAVCKAVLEEPEVIPMIAHTPEKSEDVPATCIAEGKTGGTSCAVCKAVLEEPEVIPKTGHTPVNTKEVKATCTTEGSKGGKHCAVCEKVLEEPEKVAKTGHTPVKDKAVAATCTKTGKTEGSHCSVCGVTIKKQETIAKTGHTPVKDKAVAATCTTEGKTEGSHCKVCGVTIKKQEKVAKTGHKEVKNEEVPATCTSTGKTGGSHCEYCGEAIKLSRAVEKIPHSYVENVCTGCGEKNWTVTFDGKKSYSIGKGCNINITCNNKTGNAEQIYYAVFFGNDVYIAKKSWGKIKDGVTWTWTDKIKGLGNYTLYLYTEDGGLIGSTSFEIIY